MSKRSFEVTGWQVWPFIAVPWLVGVVTIIGVVTVGVVTIMRWF